MTFREKLRRGRSHILLVVIVIVVSVIVVNLEDDTLASETGKPIPRHTVGAVVVPE